MKGLDALLGGDVDVGRRIIETLGEVAKERGVSMAQIALAWLWSKPVVDAPITGSLKTKHIDDAMAALSVILTIEEIVRLEAPYTPRRDIQGISGPVLLARSAEAATGFSASAA